jgi:hypothetical protein
MSCIEPDRRVVYPASDSFGMILPAVNTNHDELAGVFQFELPQLRENMDAVNSTVGPEVEEDNLAPQIGKFEFLTSGVNPVEVIWKLGRSNRGRRSELFRHRSEVLCFRNLKTA